MREEPNSIYLNSSEHELSAVYFVSSINFFLQCLGYRLISYLSL